MNYPGEPNYSGPMGAWLKRFLRAAISNRILPAPGYRIKRTPLGTFLGLDPGAGGAGLRTYRYKSQESEYIVCRSWDGETEGTEDVYIGKPPELWLSVDSETLRGDDIVYTYDPDPEQQTRTATFDTHTETQRITRPYEVDDIIWAASAKSFVDPTDVPGEQEVTLIDINRAGRTWLAEQTTTPE